MLQPISKHKNYYLTGGKNIYGLDAVGVSPALQILDENEKELSLSDFFSISGNLYFSISSMVEVDNPKYTKDGEEPEKVVQQQFEYYKQDADGKVSEIDSLPKRPVVRRVQFDNGTFVIKDFDYQGKACTDVDNVKVECGFERFFMVDGYAEFETGIYFNVSDGRYNEKITVRKEGLYFWPVASGRCELIRLPEGEIW